MGHSWIFPQLVNEDWNQCTCGFVATNQRQIQYHNRSNRNYRKRKKKRGKVHSQRR